MGLLVLYLSLNNFQMKHTDIKGKDSFYTEMELSLTRQLGRKVTISFRNGKGTLEFEFYDKDDLAELANKIAE